MSARDRMRDDVGFTLPELMAVVALMGIVVAAAYLLLNTGTTISNQVEAQAVATEEGRAVLSQLSSELRQAYEVDNGQGAFLVIQPREVVFYTDVNRDGFPEKVRYRIINNKIYRAQATATTEMPPYTFPAFSADQPVQGVVESTWSESVFTYYTNQYVSGSDVPVLATAAGDVSAVQVRLKNSVARGQQSASVDVTTWVKVRGVHNTID